MRSSLFLALALALGAGVASTGDAQAQRSRAALAKAEASMTLSGTIEIGVDGDVEGFSLDRRDRLDPAIATFVDTQVKQWRFEQTFVDGQPVAARTSVRLRLLANGLEGKTMSVRLADADFSNPGETATGAAQTDSVRSAKMQPPSYPERAVEMHGQGTVMLLVKVDREGKVADVVAERVNLSTLGSDRALERLREVLAKSAMTAARRWTFHTPTTGEEKDRAFWTLRVPVAYAFEGSEERDGRWHAYLPGPVQKAPWLSGPEADTAGSDLLPEGGVYMVGGKPQGPRLLTPLG